MELPAGLVDDGETPEVAALRELKVGLLHAPSVERTRFYAASALFYFIHPQEALAPTPLTYFQKQEECGYVGRIIGNATPILYVDAGMSNACMR